MDQYTDEMNQRTSNEVVDDNRMDVFSDEIQESTHNTQSGIDRPMNSPGGSRTPYKSFRKKYQKMSLQFQEAMKQNDYLYSKELAARRLFNKIVREKNTLLDIIGGLNTSEHFPDQLRINIDKLPVESNENIRKLRQNLSEDALFHLDLADLAFEYSSDEENAPKEDNPMDLVPWLKRNQPQVFTETLEKSTKDEKQMSKKRKSEGISAGSKELKPKRPKQENDMMDDESFSNSTSQSTFSVDMASQRGQIAGEMTPQGGRIPVEMPPQRGMAVEYNAGGVGEVGVDRVGGVGPGDGYQNMMERQRDEEIQRGRQMARGGVMQMQTGQIQTGQFAGGHLQPGQLQTGQLGLTGPLTQGSQGSTGQLVQGHQGHQIPTAQIPTSQMPSASIQQPTGTQSMGQLQQTAGLPTPDAHLSAMNAGMPLVNGPRAVANTNLPTTGATSMQLSLTNTHPTNQLQPLTTIPQPLTTPALTSQSISTPVLPTSTNNNIYPSNMIQSVGNSVQTISSTPSSVGAIQPSVGAVSSSVTAVPSQRVPLPSSTPISSISAPGIASSTGQSIPPGQSISPGQPISQTGITSSTMHIPLQANSGDSNSTTNTINSSSPLSNASFIAPTSHNSKENN